MHQKLKIFVLVVIFCAAFITISNDTALAQLPPLIDREIFFGNSEIAEKDFAGRQIHCVSQTA